MPSDHLFSDLEFSDNFELRKEVEVEILRKINETPADTREALETFTPSADGYQQKVLLAPESTIRLVAPAGSGKTQTIVNRVLMQIRNGLHPRKFLLLTFDNSAASSLSSKFREQVEKLSIRIDDVNISTLNAFGYRLLKDRIPHESKPVVTDARKRALLKEIKEALETKSPERHCLLPTNIKNRVYLDLFSRLKNSLFDPRNLPFQQVADFIQGTQNIYATFLPHLSESGQRKQAIQALMWLFQAYDKALQRENVLDFDDQKLRAYCSLMTNPQLLATLQSQYSEVIVDEFQDINCLDFAFIKAVVGHAKLVVTGDDDQAIYGFRGCTPDYIIDLEKHLERSVASYELQINYRCPADIVEHADRLIRYNNRRIPKNPIASSRVRSTIKVVGARTATIEARSIIAFIRKVRRGNAELRYSDFAVLYRTNAQSLPIQLEFILNDLPFHVRPEDNILHNDQLQKLLGVLRLKLACQKNDPPAIKDQTLAIQAYFRYVSPQQVDRLNRLFRSKPDFLDAISSPDFFRVLPKAKESRLPAAIREAVDASNLIRTFDVLAKKFHGLQGMIGSLEDVVDEKVPLGELYDVAASFKGSVGEFVDTMERALTRARESNAGQDSKGGVALLTYFKSKGLQWHTVVLTTCNEGIIPHRKAPLEDERRLFYVAMTRASSNLFISYLKAICSNSVSPSRFIKEAGL